MRTILMTGLGVLALGLAAVGAAPAAEATVLGGASGSLTTGPATSNQAYADQGSTFGYRCAPRARRVVVRRRYVRPTTYTTCAPRYRTRYTTCAPRYVYRPAYSSAYYARPHYYPAVSIGLGFGYGYGYSSRHRGHYGHRSHSHYGRRSHHSGHGRRHGGRSVGRRR